MPFSSIFGSVCASVGGSVGGAVVVCSCVSGSVVTISDESASVESFLLVASITSIILLDESAVEDSSSV